MSLLQVIVLAIVQGLTELLPVSSSAHVVVAEKLMGLDASSPPMTLLLVMLHTGTMFAVVVYFWRQWRSIYFQSRAAFKSVAVNIISATALTGAIGEAIVKIIERTALRDGEGGQIEDLFSHLEIIAPALALVGVLILIAGIFARRNGAGSVTEPPEVSPARLALSAPCKPFVSRSEVFPVQARPSRWPCWLVFQSPVPKRSALRLRSCSRRRRSLVKPSDLSTFSQPPARAICFLPLRPACLERSLHF